MHCFFIEASERTLPAIRRLGLENHFYQTNVSVPSLKGRGFVFSERTWKKLFNEKKPSGDKLLSDARATLHRVEISEEQAAECQSRLLYTLESYLQDPPPGEILEELQLILFANQNMCLEYIGRNISRTCPEVSEVSLQKPGSTFYFDLLGGRRRYLWCTRELDARKTFDDPRLKFQHLKRWLSDKEARVQLSLGCGALRLLAIPTVLKVLDLIGARESIDEVWGNSGGAIVGHLYAAGIAPHFIEQIGYDLYNNRYPDHSELKRSPVSTAFSTVRRLVFNREERSGIFEIQSLLTAAIEKIQTGKTTVMRSKLPFYAVAMNLEKERIFGLASNESLWPGCEDFLLGCDPIKAVAASSSIPFLFKPERLRTSDNRQDLWHDAILGEDVPLLIPYKKWRLEQKRDPKVPPKLKLLYVDLGLHYFEFFLSQKLANVGPLQWMSKFMHMSHAVFESRSEVQKDFLRMSPDVDLLGVKLQLDRAALFDVAQIPQIIQDGRTNLLKQLLEIEEQLAQREDDESYAENTLQAS